VEWSGVQRRRVKALKCFLAWDVATHSVDFRCNRKSSSRLQVVMHRRGPRILHTAAFAALVEFGRAQLTVKSEDLDGTMTPPETSCVSGYV
jgi:hypothetical protein